MAWEYPAPGNTAPFDKKAPPPLPRFGMLLCVKTHVQCMPRRKYKVWKHLHATLACHGNPEQGPEQKGNMFKCIRGAWLNDALHHKDLKKTYKDVLELHKA